MKTGQNSIFEVPNIETFFHDIFTKSTKIVENESFLWKCKITYFLILRTSKMLFWPVFHADSEYNIRMIDNILIS